MHCDTSQCGMTGSNEEGKAEPHLFFFSNLMAMCGKWGKVKHKVSYEVFLPGNKHPLSPLCSLSICESQGTGRQGIQG